MRKRQAIGMVGIGFGMQLVGFVANGLLDSRVLAHSFALLISFGGAVILVGCIRLAIAKGYAWYVGLLGFLHLVGVAILWFGLPDRTKA